MKKPVISFSAVLIMMLSISLFASAEEYCSLGSYTTGKEANCFIAFLNDDASVSSDDLPAGCELSLEGGSLSLTGTPQTAGEYTFTVNVSGDDGENVIVCSLDINTGAPTVSITSDIHCYTDTPVTVSVEATADDSGTLSYQWYAGVGGTAIPISGATGETYEPETFKEGLFGYYCSVTNTNNGESAYTDSEPVYITVTSPVITSVAIDTPPRKSAYRLGEKPDASGMSLSVSYDDGSTETVSSGFVLSPEKLFEAGTQCIEVNYKGSTCSFPITVDADENSVSGIGILTMPDKTEYISGEALDTGGLSIRAYTDGGSFDVSSGLECAPPVLSEVGRQTVTVKYAGKSCSFTVRVHGSERLLSSAVPTSTPVTLVTPALSPTPVVGSTLQSTVPIGSSETDAAPSPTVTAPLLEGSSSAEESQSRASVVMFFAVSLAALGAFLIYTRKKEK